MRIYEQVSQDVKPRIYRRAKILCEDPTFFNDPSGCTAVAALFTDDRRILVVSRRLTALPSGPLILPCRQMPVTRAVSSAPRAMPKQ